LIYQPVYNHVLLTYAFCNIDDVSWGTKGLSKDSSDRTSFYLEKVSFVARWLILNALFVALLISINLFFSSTPYVTLSIGIYATSYLLIKSIRKNLISKTIKNSFFLFELLVFLQQSIVDNIVFAYFVKVGTVGYLKYYLFEKRKFERNLRNTLNN